MYKRKCDYVLFLSNNNNMHANMTNKSTQLCRSNPKHARAKELSMEGEILPRPQAAMIYYAREMPNACCFLVGFRVPLRLTFLQRLEARYLGRQQIR